MRFVSVKTVASLVTGSVILTHSFFALAHNQAGSFTTGLAAAVDFYTVSCTDDGNGAPSYLEARVKDMTANSSKVNITIQKGTTNCNTNACARFSLDSTDSDTGYSPLIKVTQGAGTYNLYVSHTAAGTDSYDVELHCKTASGVHTGTSSATRQQQ
ncbi:hypothetical protein W03_01810 [Nitrosomonas sp. PY1]|uniref:hypothetical protein n=1 Tax=Nitrosomonas sp. PY1 TaxID=1803906 RepID=UPI001FC87D13|nr:hypothetical protein [Nitrosomonas sp. PY1]GKS68177.1 hypothetical protein W03_01810 [Nitrosomonas sp. PY1]